MFKQKCHIKNIKKVSDKIIMHESSNTDSYDIPLNKSKSEHFFMEHYKNLSLENIEGEIWKEVKGFEGLYKVSNFCRIKSCKNGRKPKMLKIRITYHGYLQTSLSKDNKLRTYIMSKLMGLHFINNPENKPCINHIDGNKANNELLNLEWCTHAENMQHAYRTGLHKSKLTEKQVISIRSHFDEINYNEIANMFGVARRTIYDILHNITWKHLL